MPHNDYMYAVDRSDEYLAHYGIKGMRWGVQKAKESGSSRKLERQWNKANRKLQQLKDRADVNKQKQLHKDFTRSAIASGIGGIAGTALMAGYNKKARDRALGELLRTGSTRFTQFNTPVFAGLTAAETIGSGIAAKIAKNRTTKEGHAKAVSDVKDWEREMKKSFAGTKYANGGSKKRRRR